MESRGNLNEEKRILGEGNESHEPSIVLTPHNASTKSSAFLQTPAPRPVVPRGFIPPGFSNTSVVPRSAIRHDSKVQISEIDNHLVYDTLNSSMERKSDDKTVKQPDDQSHLHISHHAGTSDLLVNGEGFDSNRRALQHTADVSNQDFATPILEDIFGNSLTMNGWWLIYFNGGPINELSHVDAKAAKTIGASVPALTCVDLEHSILSEMNHHKNQQAMDIMTDSLKQRKADKTSALGKNPTLEAIFGSAFVKELQAVDAPVSTKRDSFISGMCSLIFNDRTNALSSDCSIWVMMKDPGYAQSNLPVGNPDRNPYDMMEHNSSYHNIHAHSSPPQFPSQHMSQGQPMLNRLDAQHPAHHHMRFPDTMIGRDPLAIHQFSLGHQVFNQPRPVGYDPPSQLPMMQKQVHMQGSVPPAHLLRQYSGNLPRPPYPYSQVHGFGQELDPMQGFHISRQQPGYGGIGSSPTGPAHAIDITREAIRQGADAVIAVGGDGTLHEVVNGFFWAGKTVKNNDREATYSTALGLIPLGTGSDFARTFGWRNDPHEAIERISRGLRSKVDVGVISGGDGEFHYFINVADIHLSAKAGYYSSRYKRFGNLCYVIGALQGFMEHKNQDFRIKVDDGDWEMCPQVTTMCIGNAKFFGGGMKITPYADPSSGNLEVVTLQDFKWYDFILKMHKLYNGTHLSVKNVTSRRVQSIEVEDMSDSSIFVQSDGEHLGFLPRKFHILPAAIEMLT
ncbi:unnamed protein product [Rhodiola kirilowii]